LYFVSNHKLIVECVGNFVASGTITDPDDIQVVLAILKEGIFFGGHSGL
jgi:hypothetical protein